jgi:hypothetical protein
MKAILFTGIVCALLIFGCKTECPEGQIYNDYEDCKCSDIYVPTEGKFEFKGVVLDDETGEPIENCKINRHAYYNKDCKIYSEVVDSTMTSENGSYTFNEKTASLEYTIYFSKEGYIYHAKGFSSSSIEYEFERAGNSGYTTRLSKKE